MKKLLSLILGGVLTVSTIISAGCGGIGGGGGSTSKNVITFATSESTVGDLWINDAIARYKLVNPDVTVQVDVCGNEVNLLSGTDAHDIITAEAVHLNQYIQQDFLADLTELWTRESKYGEGKLEDRVLDYAKYNVKGEDGKYYGIPHNEYFSGLTYNVEIFDKHGYYFTDDKENGEEVITDYGIAYFVCDTECEKSKGPDHKTGVIDGIDYSIDDGLPATLQELAILCQFMKSQGTLPIQYPGAYPSYLNGLCAALWASLAGEEQLQVYNTFDGKIEVVKGRKRTNTQTNLDELLYGTEPLIQGAKQKGKTGSIATLPETEWVTIDKTNGYLVDEMSAKYYSLAFLETAINEGFLTEKPGTHTHTDSQKDFLVGSLDNQTEVGMMVESSYWWYEADWEGVLNKFEQVAVDRKAKDLNVRLMPLPSAVNQEAYESSERTDWTNTLYDVGGAALLVTKQASKDREHFEAILDFLDFLYSDAELKAFTKNTGMSRPLDYDIKADDPSFSKYTQALLEMKNNFKIVYHSADNPIFQRYGEKYFITIWGDCWLCFSMADNHRKLTSGYNTVAIFEAKRVSQMMWDERVRSVNWQ